MIAGANLGHLAACCERVEVASLPESVQHHMHQNETKLKLCCYDLDGEQKSHLLTMLNDDWGRPFSLNGKLTHYCSAGCCSDDAQTRRKVRLALQSSLGALFPVPLLYRWKHFEEALAYTLRNCSIHDLLPYVWAACMNTANDAGLHEQVIEIDAADQAPSQQQQVRCSKVLRLLQEPGIFAARPRLERSSPVFALASCWCHARSPASQAKLAQCAILTKPLAAYMDHISLVETVRHRVRLRLQGLSFSDSKCQHSADELASMNLLVFTGQTGWDAVHQSYRLLLQDPSSDEWHPHYRLNYQSCVQLMLTTVCDTWRRLILPYQCLTYNILRAVQMEDESGLEFIWREHRRAGECPCCQDQFFAKALWLQQVPPPSVVWH